MNSLNVSPELYDFIKKIVDDRVREIKVHREDFDKLCAKVDRLSDTVDNLSYTVENLSKTVDRLSETVNSLMVSVHELTEAQKRTDTKIAELIEAQKRTDTKIAELIEAQKRTDVKIAELVEAQKRTDAEVKELRQSIRELTEAQKRTDAEVKELRQSIRELIEAQKRTDRQIAELNKKVGNLSNEFGLTLEDIGRIVVPGWIERHLEIFVDDLERKYIYVDNREVEINFYGEGLKDGREIIIIGESKNRIYNKDVKQFIKNLELILKYFEGKEVCTFMFGFAIHPSAVEIAEKHNIHLIVSYKR